MTAPTIEQLPVRVPGRTLPPQLIHACCLICNPEWTFCGIEFDTLRRIPPGRTPSCVVCADLQSAHDWDGHEGDRP